MTWRCELFESRTAVIAKFGFVPVGAMWPIDETDARVSPNYLRDWKGKRLPLVVELPSGMFSIDGPFWNKDGPYGDGWKVTGEPPAITLAPSINIVGHYHGYIVKGVIKDDVEGRKFPNARGLP